jgi:putative membrane protein
MNIVTLCAVSLVMVLQLLFLVLEMFFWSTAFGRKTFGLSESYAKQSATLAANQGLYNGFLAAGLLWGLLSTDGTQILVFFLCCIIIAGLYGAITAKPSIFWIQAFPAAIALSLLIANS